MKRFTLLFIVIIVLIWFWYSYRSSTIEAVIVQNITKNEMRVVNFSGRETNIAVPLDLSKFLQVDKEYTISYDKRLFDKHRLRQIHSGGQ